MANIPPCASPHSLRHSYATRPLARADGPTCLVLMPQQLAPRSASPAAEVTDQATDQSFEDAAVSHNTASGTPRVCPCCKLGHLVCIGQLYPKQATGP
jgi:hypothetical protein